MDGYRMAPGAGTAFGKNKGGSSGTPAAAKPGLLSNPGPNLAQPTVFPRYTSGSWANLPTGTLGNPPQGLLTPPAPTPPIPAPNTPNPQSNGLLWLHQLLTGQLGQGGSSNGLLGLFGGRHGS